MSDHAPHLVSYRDLSGIVFRSGERIYRQVNRSFEPEYRYFMDSGLYRDLVKDALLVEHDEAPLSYRLTEEASTVIRPRQLPFISYPYEWCFNQLKDAALLTLTVLRRALKFGMTLKDSNAYNVQFEGCRPIFIDTLSFERLKNASPWPGYGQFCRHFLAPLGLMSSLDERMSGLLRTEIDGVPLDLAARLLPWSTRVGGGLRRHIHQNARADGSAGAAGLTWEAAGGQPQVPAESMNGLIDSLEQLIGDMTLSGAAPADAATKASDAEIAPAQGVSIAIEFVKQLAPKTVWDLSAGNGKTSEIVASMNTRVVAFETNVAHVDKMYVSGRKRNEPAMLPLCMSLANPTPGLGWAHTERSSLIERGPVDLILLLDELHVLAIGQGIAMHNIAEFLSQMCHWLIIEFPLPEDETVRQMLSGGRTIYENYSKEHFEETFSVNFTIREGRMCSNGQRIVYLMEAEG